MLFFILGLILLLYARTWKYYQMIDDPIPRGAYLHHYPEKPESVPIEFYETKRTPTYTLTNIGVFLGVCGAIWANFGPYVALLYAIMPTNVSGVAWATGNYYMTTVLFVMVAYFFQTSMPSMYGVVPGAIFYYTSMHSTVSAIPYSLYMLVTHWNPFLLINLIPLGLFLFGKKFRSNVRRRIEGHKKIGVEAGKLHPRAVFVMIKVVAYYIALNLWPSRLGFFHAFEKEEIAYNRFAKPTRPFWLSLILIIVFFIWGWSVSPVAILGWFFFIGIHSQFTLLGMVMAERYMFIANVFFCLLVATYLSPYPILFTILATLWFYRSHLYVPAWKHNANLFSYSISAFPYTPENYGNLAGYYMQKGDYQKSIQPLLLQAKYGVGNKLGIWINLASCYGHLGRLEASLHCTEEALKICKDSHRLPKLMEQRIRIKEMIVKTGKLQNRINNIREECHYDYL